MGRATYREGITVATPFGVGVVIGCRDGMRTLKVNPPLALASQPTTLDVFPRPDSLTKTILTFFRVLVVVVLCVVAVAPTLLAGLLLLRR